MADLKLAKEELLHIAEKLQNKKELSAHIGPDYYEPGNMENLDQYCGLFDETNDQLVIRTESKGLRYEGRTPRLDTLSVGDPVKLVREPNNPFNENNIMILSEKGENLGNLSAELCNAISPLLDPGYLTIEEAHVSYIERIRDRSRYAKQGVLFIEVHFRFVGI